MRVDAICCVGCAALNIAGACVAVHPARVQAVVQDNRSRREREEEARAKKRAFKDERDLRKKESREEDEEHAREMAKVGGAAGGGGRLWLGFPVSSSSFQFGVCG